MTNNTEYDEQEQEYLEDSASGDMQADDKQDSYMEGGYVQELPDDRVFDRELVTPASQLMFPEINGRNILNKDYTVSNLTASEMRWTEMVLDAINSCSGNKRLSHIVLGYARQAAFKANIVVSRYGFGRRQLKTVETKRSYALEDKKQEKRRWF